MVAKVARILKEIQQLSPEERADLMEQVRQGSPPPLSEEWMAEIDRRCQEIDDGTVKLLSWEQVKANMRKAAAEGAKLRATR